MPKITRQSQNRARYTTDPLAMPATISNHTPPMAYYDGRNANLAYYEPLPATHAQAALSLPSFDPYAVAPPPITIPSTSNFNHGLPTPSHQQGRPSSGAWTTEDDQTLLNARARGMNWAHIQSSHFPSKSSNACRKRHERLLERKGADDWDQRKLERMAQEYMNMRKQLWQPLAQATGEKWNVVEQKIMACGIKNLQTVARQGARRERADAAHPVTHYEDDRGIAAMALTPLDDQELQYSSPSSTGAGGARNYGVATPAMHHNPNAHAQNAGFYAADGHHQQQQHHHHHHHQHHQHQHGYSNSVSSNGTANYAQAPSGSHSPSPYMGHGQRLSSVDMGIESLIHRRS